MGRRLAAVGDLVLCPEHGMTVITQGAPTIRRNGNRVARVGDATSCGAIITTGAAWCLMSKGLAAREGDTTSHGGTIIVEDPLVILNEGGDSEAYGPANSLVDAAASGQAIVPSCVSTEDQP
ncbi:PAAR domain-containing protein [Lacibacterium aquatile]|uniref:PAAR domain-containing protein n=1 Tax=Lacibacterium aquatile TaxID=1168082 RepID=A0ABW5DUZ4_9PROT